MDEKADGCVPFFLLEGLAPAEKEQVFSQMERVRFAKGETIYSRERFRRALGVVLEGSVRVYRAGEDGRRVLMNRLEAGGVFGAAALYGECTEYVTEIEAAVRAQVGFLAQEQVTALMRRDFRAAENYIRFLSERIRFLNHKITGFTGGQADARVVGWLLEHAQGQEVCLPRSMTEWAQSLNIGRSSLYRSLDALTDAGLIRRTGRQVVLTDCTGLHTLTRPADSADSQK